MAVGETRRMLLTVTIGLFALGLVAGTIQSVRVERRLPAIDMLANGSLDYVDVLIARRDYGKAITQLQLLSRLLPHEPETYEYLGVVLGKQGRPEEARAQFEELVKRRPDYAEGYNFLGSTYFETEQFASAAAFFEQAIALKPDFPVAYNNLGMASAHLGKMDVAEKCFSRAVELAPKNTEAQTNLHWVRQQLRSRR